MSVFGFIPMGVVGVLNYDSYIFSSINGTLDSIEQVLLRGHISDAFTLLRKYYDASVMDIYIDLYLEDHFSGDNLIVKKIDDWIYGKEQLPEYRIMNNYIRKSVKLLRITELLDKDKRYSFLRNRCNDNTHYNFYFNALLNDNAIVNTNRILYLDKLNNDITNIFILHFAYLFYLNDHYFLASDYVDALDMGLEPEINSEYFVAPFIQEVFDKVIKKNRPDIADEMKKRTSMMLT